MWVEELITVIAATIPIIMVIAVFVGGSNHNDDYVYRKVGKKWIKVKGGKL